MEFEGDVVERADVGGDVVAGLAVAAGEAAHEAAGFVAETHGEAVDFGFDDVFDFFVGENFANAGVEVADFVGGVGVVDGEHGEFVGGAAEGVEGRAADALGGRGGVEEIGVGGFEVEEFAVEAVVFLVGDFWGGVEVVEAVVAVEVGAELEEAVFGGIRHGGILQKSGGGLNGGETANIQYRTPNIQS